ncbi:retrovirus-related pol polyprotein from transposon TNT 1-94 [Tanacetum coccineum]
MFASNNSNNSNQQTLAESGANVRPPMLEKGNYIPWESRFRSYSAQSRLMDEFVKFATKEGESLDSMYERAKKAAKNHDPLALIDHSNASSSHPHANSSYARLYYYSLELKDLLLFQHEKKWQSWVSQCYSCNKKGHYARDCHKPKVRDAKYFREQILLAMKDEARSHLSNEENDFMLDNAYGEESLDELTASVMLMARL